MNRILIKHLKSWHYLLGRKQGYHAVEVRTIRIKFNLKFDCVYMLEEDMHNGKKVYVSASSLGKARGNVPGAWIGWGSSTFQKDLFNPSFQLAVDYRFVISKRNFKNYGKSYWTIVMVTSVLEEFVCHILFFQHYFLLKVPCLGYDRICLKQPQMLQIQNLVWSNVY